MEAEDVRTRSARLARGELEPELSLVEWRNKPGRLGLGCADLAGALAAGAACRSRSATSSRRRSSGSARSARRRAAA